MYKSDITFSWIRIISFTILETWSQEENTKISPKMICHIENRFIEKLNKIPIYISYIFKIFTFIMWIIVILKYFKISNLSFDERYFILKKFENSRFPFNNYFLFIEKLTILFFFEFIEDN